MANYTQFLGLLSLANLINNKASLLSPSFVNHLNILRMTKGLVHSLAALHTLQIFPILFLMYTEKIDTYFRENKCHWIKFNKHLKHNFRLHVFFALSLSTFIKFKFQHVQAWIIRFFSKINCKNYLVKVLSLPTT